MHLFLIRHGETVDNVAGIIAGVRDSPLTNYGFQQATRLGQFLNIRGVDFTHVFSSPLQRAYVTAEQIRNGQSEPNRNALTVIPLHELQEQDFGLLEGVSYREYSQGDSRHASVESVESMSRRASIFTKESILPLFHAQSSPVVAVVSHGRMLQELWPQILSIIKPTSVVCDQQLLVDSRSIDHTQIRAWSNTGFVEVTFSRALLAQPSYPVTPMGVSRGEPRSVAAAEAEADSPHLQADAVDSVAFVPKLGSYTAVITAINGRDHLNGLSRARGGLGSARYDSRQGTLDKFFVQPRPG